MKRTKLADRELPTYSNGEEIMNMTTHIIGGGLGFIALILCIIQAAIHGGVVDILGAVTFGASLILLYTMSSIYHGLKPGMGKLVLQVLDHCTIYALIAGSYTPVALSAIRPHHPVIGIGLVAAEWLLAGIAITLTAIDLNKYNVFSMVCYIGMGWGIIVFLPQTIASLGMPGFWLLLIGGISYTIGAVLYGIGGKKPWFHSVFHIFVLIGSILHFFAIYLYALT